MSQKDYISVKCPVCGKTIMKRNPLNGTCFSLVPCPDEEADRADLSIYCPNHHRGVLFLVVTDDNGKAS